MPNPNLYGPDEVPLYAYCESVYAGGSSPWHIRKIVPGVGLKLGGGIDSTSLCGRVKPMDKGGAGGWDLRVRISSKNLLGACAACTAEYRKRVIL